MGPGRILLIVFGALVLLVGGLLSYSLLDFGPGAWIAAGVVMAGVAARIIGSFGGLPDDWDLDL